MNNDSSTPPQGKDLIHLFDKQMQTVTHYKHEIHPMGVQPVGRRTNMTLDRMSRVSLFSDTNILPPLMTCTDCLYSIQQFRDGA